MDPTTNPHIEPTSLQPLSPGTDGLPSLGVRPMQPDVVAGQSVAVPLPPAQPGSHTSPSSTMPSYQAPPTPASTMPSDRADSTPSSNMPSHQTGSTPSSVSTSQATASTQSNASITSKLPSNPTATGLRQRVNALGGQLDSAADHPAVKNAKGAAQQQVNQARQQLGRFPILVDLEKRTGVDRVFLVVAGILLYILLIPLNVFGLGYPTTTFLALVPSSYLALGILEQPSNEKTDAATRTLLSYFVVLGFIQFLESLAANVLYRRIPQYYTVKLLLLAYLLHPRTQGAMWMHQNIFQPVLARAQASASPVTTPPQSGPAQSHSNAASPTFPPSSNLPSQSNNAGTTGTMPKTNPFAQADGMGNVTRLQASGESFEGISELR